MIRYLKKFRNSDAKDTAENRHRGISTDSSSDTVSAAIRRVSNTAYTLPVYARYYVRHADSMTSFIPVTAAAAAADYKRIQQCSMRRLSAHLLTYLHMQLLHSPLLNCVSRTTYFSTYAILNWTSWSSDARAVLMSTAAPGDRCFSTAW